MSLLKMLEQIPLITKSNILLLGQNPGKRQLTHPAKHPFGLHSKAIVNPNIYNELYKLGASWALTIANDIFCHSYTIPNIANLVTIITHDNKITESMVWNYSQDVRGILKNSNIKLVFCFGNQTYKYFNFYFGNKYKTIKLAHPAYVYRWKQKDEKYLYKQRKIVYNSIMED